MATDFPPSVRLRTPKQYATAFKQGRRLGNAQFGWVWMPAGNPAIRDDELPARLGLAISKKCDKRAVQRNRIKRVIREWFRTQTLPAGDLVVSARPGASRFDNAALRASLEDLRLRLSKPPRRSGRRR